MLCCTHICLIQIIGFLRNRNDLEAYSEYQLSNQVYKAEGWLTVASVCASYDAGSIRKSDKKQQRHRCT